MDKFQSVCVFVCVCVYVWLSVYASVCVHVRVLCVLIEIMLQLATFICYVAKASYVHTYSYEALQTQHSM